MSLILFVFRRTSTLKSLDLSKFYQLTIRQADIHLGDPFFTDEKAENESLHSLPQITQFACRVSVFSYAEGRRNDHLGKL